MLVGNSFAVAQGVEQESRSITQSEFAASLKPEEFGKRQSLDAEQKSEVIRLVSNPEVAKFSNDSEAKAISKNLAYVSQAEAFAAPSGPNAGFKAAANRRGTQTHKSGIQVFGIDVSTAFTVFDFEFNGSRVTNSISCITHITNFLPTRSLSSSNYTRAEGTKMVCE